jgi:hypothetical protein
MYEYLRKHPDIFMPYRKEPVYFGADLTKRLPYLDEAGYLALFDGADGRRRVGEATVWYLYSRSAPAEIKDFNPEARIIIMLRNPVDMIHSLHSHWLFTANEDIVDFEQALAAEDHRRLGARLPAGVRRPEGLQYRSYGRYASHVRRYIETFGSQSVKVILYDDFTADPAKIYRETLEFLEVDPSFQPGFPIVNQNKGVRSKLLQRLTYAPLFLENVTRLPAPIAHPIWRFLKRLNMRYEPRHALDPQVRARLVDDFADDIRELSRLIGRDLALWLAPINSGGRA